MKVKVERGALQCFLLYVSSGSKQTFGSQKAAGNVEQGQSRGTEKLSIVIEAFLGKSVQGFLFFFFLLLFFFRGKLHNSIM